jgi:D-aminopeptidase
MFSGDAVKLVMVGAALGCGVPGVVGTPPGGTGSTRSVPQEIKPNPSKKILMIAMSFREHINGCVYLLNWKGTQTAELLDAEIRIYRLAALMWQNRHMAHRFVAVAVFLLLTLSVSAQSASSNKRPRASDLGLKIGVLPRGPLNAITDVDGVTVGHTTIVRGDNIRTGVTAVLPHAGNLFHEKVPGAVFVANAYGKLAGSTQVEELGNIETPILLTNTVSVPQVGDALTQYMLQLPGNEDVRSVNPLVGETNDGYLNDIRGRHIKSEDVFAAIKNAKGGPVDEGNVGAGTGTVAFGWKGGIGTSSRRLPQKLGGYTVGVLVQTNFGGVFTVAGAPVGQELGQYYLREELQQKQSPDGSCMIVIATDAPIDARNLKRLAARAWLGMARTGSSASNGSGDYSIAFSTAPQLRIRTSNNSVTQPVELLTNDAMSPLFEAVIEATEEAIYNSMFRATTMTGNGHTVDALPIEKIVTILREYRAIK